MCARDRRVQVWFDRPRTWAAELNALRQIVHETPLDENFKWRQPCYTHNGTNVALLSEYKDGCVLSLLRGVLLQDQQGLLQLPGPNSRAARVLKFTDSATIAAQADAIRDLLAEAIALVDSGTRPDLPKHDFDLPEELTDTLDSDPDLAAAWAALTPGRQRGYVLHIAGAKQSATRHNRIAKHRPRILDGKGPHDR